MQAPAFNYPNESRRRFCADHKLDGMLNLRKKRPRSELDLAVAVASQPQVTDLNYCFARQLSGAI